jgi:hypothetical protein
VSFHALACHSSLTVICSAPASGIDTSAATKAPKVPPTQSPTEVPTRMDTRTNSGFTFVVRLITTGFRMWFSTCV